MATVPKTLPRSKAKASAHSRPHKSQPASIGASKAKASLLELLDSVSETRSAIVITKRGKPIARLTPIEDKPFDIFGCMKGTGRITGDIVSPEPDVWEAMVD